MKTKKELQAEIERLNGIIRDQANAIGKLSRENGVSVDLPHRAYAMTTPIQHGSKSARSHKDRIEEVIFNAVKDHGIPHGWPMGAFSRNELNFRDFHGGMSFIIPKMAAGIIADLVNAIADYGLAMRAEGIEEGNSLLKGLATGKISSSEYDDTVKMERKRAGKPVGRRLRIQSNA